MYLKHWLLWIGVSAETADHFQKCRGVHSEIEICKESDCETEPCIDCLWEQWSDWGPCTCEGIQDRHRSIDCVNTHCGRPCEGVKVETQRCQPECQKPPTDCILTDWTVWSQCDKTCDEGQQFRSREIQQNSEEGGKPCDGYLKETQTCRLAPCGAGQDCVMGPWSPWDPCSASCETGQQERRRAVSTASESGGTPCEDPIVELRGCNQQGCENAVDCKWGEWVPFSACSKSCGGGEKLRSRLITAAPRKGGQKCDPHTMSEIEACNVQSCVESLDCEFTDWSPWSDCSCTCKGTRARTRHVAVYSQHGGRACNGSLKDIEPCNVDDCGQPVVLEKVDCVLGAFSEWSLCSATCATGQQSRAREVETSAENGGEPCNGDISETRGCAENSCPVPVEEKKFAPVDCRWDEWADWEPCSASCNGGFKQRQRTILQMANCYGKPCELGDAIETAPCNTQGCGCRDCEWAPWTEWGSCTCTGLRERHRSIAVTVGDCGEPCSGAKAETTSCQPDCGVQVIDCVLGDWGDWGECPKTCGGAEEFRTRQVERLSRHGGKPCEADTREIRPCAQEHCTETMDCELSDWDSWSLCTATCGGGQQFRTRMVDHSAHRLGGGCQDKLEEIRGCGSNACGKATDCKWGDWTKWSPCSATCGNGQKSRDRSIAVAPREGGKLCHPYDKEEITACKDRDCGAGCIDALWGDWTDFGLCSSSCGGGYQSRTRPVLHGCNHCGKALEGLSQEYRKCNDGPCTNNVVDCSFDEWEPWGACSCSCNGVHERTRQVSEYARNLGEACNGAIREVAPCNVQICQSLEIPRDCKLSDWADWSDCTAECGGGLTYRRRHVEEPPVNGGNACQGNLKEVFACNYIPCESSVDCKWGEWAEWDTCSDECGGGQKSRYRHIILMCSHGGKGCDTKAGVETKGCNLQPCGKLVYCGWGEWNQWGECSASCGNGTRKRSRHMEQFSVEPEGQILDSGILEQMQDIDFKRFSADHLLVVFTGGILLTTFAFVLFTSWSRRWRYSSVQTTDPGVALLTDSDDMEPGTALLGHDDDME